MDKHEGIARNCLAGLYPTEQDVNDAAAILREAFPEPAQAAPSEDDAAIILRALSRAENYPREIVSAGNAMEALARLRAQLAKEREQVDEQTRLKGLWRSAAQSHFARAVHVEKQLAEERAKREGERAILFGDVWERLCPAGWDKADWVYECQAVARDLDKESPAPDATAPSDGLLRANAEGVADYVRETTLKLSRAPTGDRVISHPLCHTREEAIAKILTFYQDMRVVPDATALREAQKQLEAARNMLEPIPGGRPSVEGLLVHAQCAQERIDTACALLRSEPRGEEPR